VGTKRRVAPDLRPSPMTLPSATDLNDAYVARVTSHPSDTIAAVWRSLKERDAVELITDRSGLRDQLPADRRLRHQYPRLGRSGVQPAGRRAGCWQANEAPP
jgi:hypothetical protein